MARGPGHWCSVGFLQRGWLPPGCLRSMWLQEVHDSPMGWEGGQLPLEAVYIGMIPGLPATAYMTLWRLAASNGCVSYGLTLPEPGA